VIGTSSVCIDNPGATYGVVLDGAGLAIGCGGYGRRCERAVLTWGIVHAGYHGRGIGRFLLIERLARIRALGEVSVIEMNTSGETLGFFERSGFRTVRFAKDGYRIGLDRYDLELELN
jgi:ribosomal protein S18 acetylase RimI-like enzyme